MASSPELVAYICEQLEGIGTIRSRKMFGEYMVYINDKPVVMVCDDTVFIKMLPCLEQLLEGNETALPYEGAKPHYILDPDDREILCQAASLAEMVTLVPKKRVSRKS